MKKCSTCDSEMFQDCHGRDRCEECDPPCPYCDDGGGPGYRDGEDEPNDIPENE